MLGIGGFTETDTGLAGTGSAGRGVVMTLVPKP